jgi:sugar phosphate isomerase/epimerase
MKLSVIDTLCPRDSLRDKLSLLERLGIEGIELESALPAIAQEGQENVLEALASSNVKLSTMLLGYQGGLQSQNREMREKTVDRIKQYLRACSDLGGVGVVTVPSDRRGRSPFRFSFGGNKENRKQSVVENYRTLGKYAQDLGVYIIIEPLDHFHTNFINTCDEAVEICRMTGSNMVRTCPDLFHMSIEEPNISEKIDGFSEYIIHLHIGDNDGKSKFAVLPGKGNLDFTSILGTLKKIQYSNYLSLDCRIPNEAEMDSSVQFLRTSML